MTVIHEIKQFLHTIPPGFNRLLFIPLPHILPPLLPGVSEALSVVPYSFVLSIIESIMASGQSSVSWKSQFELVLNPNPALSFNFLLVILNNNS